MQAITLSKKKYSQLTRLTIPHEVFNTEANIYEMTYKNDVKIFKSLHCLNGETFANKMYTLEMLNEYKSYFPKEIYIPDSLVTYKNQIIGFTVPKARGINLSVVLADRSIPADEKAKYLGQVGALLEKLKNMRKYSPAKDFYLNDLHDSNFLVDCESGGVNAIDIDSSKIASNQPFPSRFLIASRLVDLVPNKYCRDKRDFVIANEDTDLYCYMMMLLNFLYGGKFNTATASELYNYLNYLEYIGVYQPLINCFSLIAAGCPNENPFPYIESLTNEQICRANKSVYSRVLKK